MNPDDHIDDLIAYVEGQLPPERLAQFEARLAASPELQRQLQLLRRTDDSLRHSLNPPYSMNIDFDAARASAASSNLPIRAATGGWKRWAGLVGGAVAASILIVLSYTYINDKFLNPKRTPLTVGALYSQYVAHGFEPAWVCKDDAEFVQTTMQAFGIPLLARSTADVEIVGWTGYYDRLTELGTSPNARGILARVNRLPVMVIIDKAAAGEPIKLDRSARRQNLRLFQKQLDGVVLYEITPLDHPAAIDAFLLQPGE